LTKEAAAQRSEAERLRNEHAQLLADIERQEKENRESSSRIDAARATLQELQEESHRSGMAELESRINQVYALLPPDLADKAC